MPIGVRLFRTRREPSSICRWASTISSSQKLSASVFGWRIMVVNFGT